MRARRIDFFLFVSAVQRSAPLPLAPGFLSHAQRFPLLSAGRSSPGPFSLDPASPTVGSAGRAPGVPTKFHNGSLLWVNVSNREADRAFKTEEGGFFHLRKSHRDDVGKG